jgi:hypothetical protein
MASGPSRYSVPVAASDNMKGGEGGGGLASERGRVRKRGRINEREGVTDRKQKQKRKKKEEREGEGGYNNELCQENPIYVFLFWELCGLSPNFHIHVSVSDLYIPRMGPNISYSRKG